MKRLNQGRSLHIVQHLRPGGIESLALEMLRTGSGDTYILSLEGNKQEAVEAWPRLEAFSDKLIFMNKDSGFSFTLSARIRSVVSSLDVDVVHSHHIGPLIYAGLALKGLNLTHIHTEHDAWHLDNPKHQMLEKLLLKIAKPRLVADADLVAKKLQRHFPTVKISTITNGIDCNKFKPRSQALSRQLFGLPQGKTLVGCAGRLETVKGHALLIKAMRFLPQDIALALQVLAAKKNN
ncbi:glycosyltransferase sypP [Vibrio ishigakensis]|uniref:Glycosyltransferase sypP n=1 Tax=Vibrio ishigakensis TaxID=1481914 RepID=A0A0B8P5E4_9VIBR|nr:glycosyltransferase sypP [Vibrio ishigakensis]